MRLNLAASLVSTPACRSCHCPQILHIHVPDLSSPATACSTAEKWLSAADAAWKRALPEEAWQAHGIAAAAWRASGTQVAEWRASGERAGWQRHVSCSHASAKPGMCALPTVFAVPRADTVFPCASTSSTSEAMAKALGEASASCLLPAQLRLLLGGLRAAAHSSGASVLVCHAGVPEQAAQAAQAAVGASAWHRMLLEHTARHGKDAQAASAWEYIAAQLPVAVLDDALQLRVYAGLDCEPAIAAFAGDVAVDADSLADLPRSLPLQAADAEPRAVYEQGGAGPWRVLPAERAPTAPTLPSEAAWLADMLPKHPNAQHRPLPAGTDVDAAVLACVQELVSGDFIPTTDAAARPSPTRAAKASRVSSLPQQSAGSDDEYGVPSSRAGRAASQVDSRASPAASAGPTPTSAAASAANPAAFWQSMMAGGGAPSSRTRSKRTAATVGKRTPK